MQHYHRIVKCPHCNRLTGYSHTHSPELVGNPLRVCSHCQKSYWDFSYTEDAIAFYKKNTAPHPLIPFLLLVASIGVMIESIVAVISKDKSAIIILILSLFVAIIAAKMLAKQFYFAFHKEKLVAIAEKALDYSAESDTSLSASLSRLSRPEYLEFLTDNDIEVPVYFYNRIHYDPPKKFAEKHAEKIMKEEKDLEQLLEKQKVYKVAKRFLSAGIYNRDFVTAATEMRMSPEEFKAYCKKTVEAYEAMHREYNLTHSTPAPMPGDYD